VIEEAKTDAVRREAIAWLLGFGILYFLYRVSAPFLPALTWAAILAIFFFPVHRRVCKRLPGRNTPALASVVAVALLLILPVAWLAPAFIVEAIDAVGRLPTDEIVDTVERAVQSIDARLPEGAGSVEEMAADAVKAVRNRLGQWSALAAGNIVGFILDFIVLMLAMFYLFRDGPRLVEFIRDVSPFGGERHDRMVGEAIDMITVTISSGFVTAGVQGLLAGLVFAVLGLPSPILWGVITALMAFLPLVGAWMIWLPAGIGLLLEGQTARGVALLILGVLLISLVDNILRPWLIADRSQLNGLFVFVSILGGIQAFGLLGVVLGPLVTATAVGLVTGYREAVRNETAAPASSGGPED